MNSDVTANETFESLLNILKTQVICNQPIPTLLQSKGEILKENKEMSINKP